MSTAFKQSYQLFALYKKIYGFEMGADKKVFDLVVEADDLDAKAVFDIAMKKVREKFSLRYG